MFPFIAGVYCTWDVAMGTSLPCRSSAYLPISYSEALMLCIPIFSLTMG